MTISKQDELMIALLQQNGRMAVADLARKLNVSRTAARMRLEKLERQGVIIGYCARLSPRYHSGRMRALVMIKSPASRRDSIEQWLTKMPHLLALYSISGSFDLAAIISAQSSEDLDRCIDEIGKLPGVEDTMSSVILSTKVDR